MRINRLKILILPILFFAISLPHTSIEASIRIKDIASTFVQKKYRLYIFLSDDNKINNQNCYVIYLLDGDKHFHDVVRAVSGTLRDTIPRNIMIVGIGYGKGEDRRICDYTPTRLSGWPCSGGLRRFFFFVRHEAIPYIDNHYRTISNSSGRCIAGHSLGGLAVYFGLLFNDDLFDKYISISPALWWDRELFFKYKMDFSARRSDSPVKIYNAVGSRDDSYTISILKRFTTKLKRRAALKCYCKYSLFRGKGHYDVVPDALREGIFTVFQ